MDLPASAVQMLIPPGLFSDPRLTACALRLWLILRALAGEHGETPPLSYQQLSNLSGFKRTALYHNLRFLSSCGLLQMRLTPTGERIFLFSSPFEPTKDAAPCSAEPNSGSPMRTGVKTNAPPLNPPVNPIIKLTEEVKRGQNPPKRTFATANTASAKLPGAGSDEGVPTRPESDPAELFHQVIGLRPSRYQRQLLLKTGLDPLLWRQTLEHWKLHGWSPKNLQGMLDLYGRGGPPACRYCGKKAQQNEAGSQQKRSLDTLKALRQEVGNG